MTKTIQYPGVGCIVEFMQGNAAQIAWVLEEQAGKLRLMLPNRRETPLQASRLLPWSGPQYGGGKSKEEIVQLLTRHREKREALAASLDVRELWSLAQGEMDKATAQWLTELLFADADADSVAACGQALLACKSHFRFQPPDFEIFSEAEVLRRQEQEEAQRQREALVGGGAEWLRQLWEARVARKSPPAPSQAPDEPVRSRLVRMLLTRIADPESQEDEGLWRQVSKNLPDDPHLALLLATSWGLVPEHYNYWLDRAGYSPGDAWSEEFLPQTEELLARRDAAPLPPLEQARPLVSIDSPSTRDIDDAFHLESLPEGGWEVTVSLACPALFWPFGSPLDKAVSRRATSIYLPEGEHHMMPEALGVDGYSLWAGHTRPSLLVRCRVAADGSILEAAPALASVNLSANLHYPDCEAVLAGQAGEGNPALTWAAMLSGASAMAHARLDWRIRQGAVIIERPEPGFHVEGEGENTVVVLEPEESFPEAQLLVSELMILANSALAEWAVAQGLPLLFRTQNVALPPEYAGIWREAPDIARIVRALIPASLEVSPRPHAGMGLAAYCAVTSPLRRYPDLVNEAQIIAFLQNGTPRWSCDELAALLTPLGVALDAAGQVQRFRPRYWKLLYVQQQAKRHGEACAWDAVVSDENDASVTLLLPREQIQVRGKRSLFSEKLSPGQQLKVRLGKINPLRGDIQIMAVQEN